MHIFPVGIILASRLLQTTNLLLLLVFLLLFWNLITFFSSSKFCATLSRSDWVLYSLIHCCTACTYSSDVPLIQEGHKVLSFPHWSLLFLIIPLYVVMPNQLHPFLIDTLPSQIMMHELGRNRITRILSQCYILWISFSWVTMWNVAKQVQFLCPFVNDVY